MAGTSCSALVTHAMVPEALHQGEISWWRLLLPTVAGFLAALYLILAHKSSSVFRNGDDAGFRCRMGHSRNGPGRSN